METRKKIKSSPADKVFTVCNTIFMILFIIITLYPICLLYTSPSPRDA